MLDYFLGIGGNRKPVDRSCVDSEFHVAQLQMPNYAAALWAAVSSSVHSSQFHWSQFVETVIAEPTVRTPVMRVGHGSAQIKWPTGVGGTMVYRRYAGNGSKLNSLPYWFWHTLASRRVTLHEPLHTIPTFGFQIFIDCLNLFGMVWLVLNLCVQFLLTSIPNLCWSWLVFQCIPYYSIPFPIMLCTES